MPLLISLPPSDRPRTPAAALAPLAPCESTDCVPPSFPPSHGSGLLSKKRPPRPPRWGGTSSAVGAHEKYRLLCRLAPAALPRARIGLSRPCPAHAFAPVPPSSLALLAPPSLAHARCPGALCEAPLLLASLRFGRGALAPAPPALALGLPKSLAAPRPALRYAVVSEGLASLLLRPIALPISC